MNRAASSSKVQYKKNGLCEHPQRSSLIQLTFLHGLIILSLPSQAVVGSGEFVRPAQAATRLFTDYIVDIILVPNLQIGNALVF